MEVPMKRFVAAFLAGLAAVASLADAQGKAENFTSQPFSEGGTVSMKLSSGTYSIKAGAGDRIVVHWQAEDPCYNDDLKKVRVRTDSSGNAATIRTEGPTHHIRFTIEIPARSDLSLRMRAGDIRVEGVEGNKDIRMTAGDLIIEVRPASYAKVHASVTFGDLRAQPLGISKDGIRQRLDWSGTGAYKLHASLFAGDVSLLRAALH
jgi:hypothetical protein